MSTSSFRGSEALDLSALTQQAGRPAGGSAASYLVEVTEANFNDIVTKSLQYAVVLEFTTRRVPQAAQLSQMLEQLATEAGGKFLLGRIDADAQPQLPQALGVQGVPMVVGIVGGQLVPLFQGVLPKDQAKAYLDQLLQAAVANGIVGTAPPVSGAVAADDEEGEPIRDERFAAADAALDAGDYALARAEFDQLVTANPKDAEAIMGRAGAALLQRGADLDLDVVVAAADASPDDVAAQLTAADAQMLLGESEGALARLLRVVRRTAGDERNTVRLRYLELLDTFEAGDPIALKARRDLMAALF